MNEITKSIAFIGAAAAFVALAITSTPNKIDPTSKGNRMGQALFETFDTRSATGIEIVEIDAEKLEAKSIEIAQTDKGWWIRRPQKPDYPANADNQVKDVSTILLDLRILDVASEGSGEHAKYGVLDPSRANPGDSGVGKSIALKLVMKWKGYQVLDMFVNPKKTPFSLQKLEMPTMSQPNLLIGLKRISST